MTGREVAEALDAADPLAGFRARFVGVESGPVYLDGNSLGRPPRSGIGAVRDALDDWAGRLVGGWADWVDLPTAVGDRLGALVGAGPGQVVVADSTTVNLYKAVGAALDARPDRPTVVAWADDFPTDRYVVAGLAAERGRRLALVDSDAGGGPRMDQLLDAVDDSTAVVVLSHVDFRSAAVTDLAAVTEAAHRSGALVVWDLSHAAGVLPVDLDGAGADLAVGCSYKYLHGGPGAPGWLYVAAGLQAVLRQPIHGWFGQRDQFAMGAAWDPEPGPVGWLTGTPSVLGLAAVDAGVAVVAEAGIAAVSAKSRMLTGLIVDLADRHLVPLGVGLASPVDAGRRGGHVALAHPAAWPLCQTARSTGLAVTDFRPPDVIRLGPGPLDTRAVDVWDAVTGLADLLASGAVRVGDGAGRPRVT